MKYLSLLAFGSVTLASSGYVKYELETKRAPLVKRQAGTQGTEVPLQQGPDQNLYWLNVSIGTPPQPFRQQLDTGSSVLWVPASSTKKCQAGGLNCPGGSFDSSQSSTFSVQIQDGMHVAYGDGTADNGSYFADVVTIGAVTIPAGTIPIGLADLIADGKIPNDGQGLVGVGYNVNYADPDELTQYYNGTTPPTVVGAMVQVGAIQRESYSLYLNDLESGVGDIVFGGVDPGKYTGECVVVPFAQEPEGGYREFLVNLTAITFDGGPNGPVSLLEDTAEVPSLLDSGSTVISVPPVLYQDAASAFNVDKDGYVQCDIRDNKDLTIEWTFGGSDGITIKTPLSDIIAPWDGQTTYAKGGNACSFGISSQDPEDGVPLIIFGDSFLRSAYVVYDLENNQAALAQAKLNSTDESITAIPSGTEIPGCTRTAIAAGGATGTGALGTGTIAPVSGASSTGGSAASATGAAPSSSPSSTGGAARVGSIGLGMVGIAAVFLSL